jgi:hypothetical protein|tara:strand:- start:369 stop:599 length:231 start_codon:yes stop_codon:yes gene_type:complete
MGIIMMDLMAEVTFTPNASKRTKDRIREHGPVFKMESFDNPPCMDGVPSVFLRSKDGWFGWLIKDEILCRAPEMDI